MNKKIALPVLVTFALLAACSGDDEPSAKAPSPEAQDTAPVEEQSAAVEQDQSAPVDSYENVEEIEIVPGLTKKILREGNGRAARAGDSVEVHYTGWLFDPDAENGRGDKFDSSVDRGETFRFPLGAGRVIKGWDQGVEGMLVGEVAELKIAPEMGYGDRGAGAVIPPGATLIFEVELFGPTDDGG